jgi:hypothetical protein
LVAIGPTCKLWLENTADSVTALAAKEGPSVSVVGDTYRIIIGANKRCVCSYDMLIPPWIDRSAWREINDILTINGFAWLENGKESEWIKMKRQGITISTEEQSSGITDQDLRDYGSS